MALKSTTYALYLALAEPELTARPRFRVLNFHQGQSVNSSCSHRAVHIGKNKSKTSGFYQMQETAASTSAISTSTVFYQCNLAFSGSHKS